MRGKGFTFKQFYIDHSRCAMKVGTDGTLLGAWAEVPAEGRILDIGTGTGLIAIMAAQRTSSARITAIDIDSACIEQARENVAATEWHERIEVTHSSLQEFASAEPFDMIISNPPYIPTDVIDMLSSEVQYEPHSALDGGEDGLRYYRAIVAYAPLILKKDGIIIFEIGYDQAEDVSHILEEAGYSVAVLKDYAKNDRVIFAKRG
jgi:HemK-like putative methylase